MTITFEESDRYTDAQGITMHSNEAGSGQPLLCFHGGGPGANAWANTERNIAALAEHFHLILLDLPGFGRSDALEPLEGETQDRLQARAILSFMDARSIEHAHLYGTSGSGAPVLRLAVEHPDRVDRIALKSPALGVPNFLGTTPQDGIQALNDFTSEPTRDNMVKIMKFFVPRAELLTDEMIESRYQSAINAKTPQKRPLPIAFLLGEIKDVRARTLVLWGYQDHMVPLEGALLALASIPDVEVHIWGGQTGHFIEWEHTEKWNRLVIDFLTRD